ncbi:MAG: DUF5119 domain-containing protein [Bacteroides sp.]
MKNGILKGSGWIALLLLLVSCQRDHLYYKNSERALIQVNMDWSKAGVTPNGATIIAYHTDGTLFQLFPYLNNPHSSCISLPEGNYQLLVHNDVPDEYKFIDFLGMDHLHTLEARIREKGTPDTLAVALLTNVVVTPQMIDYYYNRPDEERTEAVNKLYATPARVITLVKVRAHVKGLCYAASAPKALLRNMAAGYLLGIGQASDVPFHFPFVINNRKYDQGSQKDGVIHNSFSSFGLRPQTKNEKNRYFIDLDVTLINGAKYPLSVEVTDQMKVTNDGKQEVINIWMELELPEVIGGGTGDGAFDTDVEEWNDVEIEIPME